MTIYTIFKMEIGDMVLRSIEKLKPFQTFNNNKKPN